MELQWNNQELNHFNQCISSWMLVNTGSNSVSETILHNSNKYWWTEKKESNPIRKLVDHLNVHAAANKTGFAEGSWQERANDMKGPKGGNKGRTRQEKER